MREIRLLTETSTQIRVSVDPKAPPQPNQGEQTIITRNSAFWQVFLAQRLPNAPGMARDCPWRSDNGRGFVLCYDERRNDRQRGNVGNWLGPKGHPGLRFTLRA